MSECVMFVFGGRKPNVELQMPFVHRILDEHPDLEFHIWNLARDSDDAEYLSSLSGDRITVRNDFYGGSPWKHFNSVFAHYARPEYSEKLFVKLDDDVIFIETDRFGAFLEAIRDHPDSVVSAMTINNGACLSEVPPLWRKFLRMGIPRLDVHLHAAFAEVAHQHFFDHADDILDQPLQLVPTEEWLSINMIGYDHQMAIEIASKLGHPSPAHIAGRNFRAKNSIGDEGRVNMLPRKILVGFTVGHLYFGPQAQQLRDDQLDGLRKQYAELGQQYLARTR